MSTINKRQTQTTHWIIAYFLLPAALFPPAPCAAFFAAFSCSAFASLPTKKYNIHHKSTLHTINLKKKNEIAKYVW